MEAKYTKGEWKSAVNTVYALHQTGWFKGEPVMSNRFYVGVYVDKTHGVTEEELNANVKLITAAPELLEALIEAYKELEFHNWHNTTTGMKIKEAIKLAIE